MANRKPNNTPALTALGISHEDAQKLRRIERRLHRWQALRCGIAHPLRADWTVCVECDNEGKNPVRRVSGNDKGQWFDHRTPCRDDYALAQKRLAKIMAAYPALTAYVQPDVRGCALYIIDPATLPKPDADLSLHYWPRGIAVY